MDTINKATTMFGLVMSGNRMLPYLIAAAPPTDPRPNFQSIADLDSPRVRLRVDVGGFTGEASGHATAAALAPLLLEAAAWRRV
uniref:Uncharacterized protein n=1 Tax=Oryza nivara TaxID=4536 RepID=A0A0E0GE87_ORYNI